MAYQMGSASSLLHRGLHKSSCQNSPSNPSGSYRAPKTGYNSSNCHYFGWAGLGSSLL
ncbi:hypothetical protein BD310DRAFT_919170 [Dichomitus squalens]|uniref:Uncharacterized protein n=1 Tax=Dichomitus squalens TaxID=114155 RepID=A0A4Q9Q5N7_9APHY|nr:hypothetical protein BD310DRAFT_919170 [Dichomitus squalens]